MEGDSQDFEGLVRVVRHLKSESFEPLIVWREKLCLGRDIRLFEKIVVKSFKPDWNLNDFQQFCDALGIMIEIDNTEVFVDFNKIQSSTKTSQKKLNLLFSRRRCSIRVNSKLNKKGNIAHKISELYKNLEKAHYIQKLIVEASNKQKCN